MQPQETPAVAAAIEALAASLGARHDRLAAWLDTPEPLWSARPAPGAWSIGEVVEHVVLMQRYVLLLVDKIGARCLRRRAAGAPLPEALEDLEELEALARQDRRWPHPVHMTPTGGAGREALERELAEQRERCLTWLERLPAGEGALHAIGMSVLGRKLDLYGFLRLIDAHLARHLRQLERARAGLRPDGPEWPPAPAAPAP